MWFQPSYFSLVLNIIYRGFGKVPYAQVLTCVPSSLIPRFRSFINLCHCRQAVLDLQRTYSYTLTVNRSFAPYCYLPCQLHQVDICTYIFLHGPHLNADCSSHMLHHAYPGNLYSWMTINYEDPNYRHEFMVSTYTWAGPVAQSV